MPAYLLTIAILLTAAITCAVSATIVLLGARDRAVGRPIALAMLCIGAYNTQLGLQSLPGFASAWPSFMFAMHFFAWVLPALVLHVVTLWAERTSIAWKRLVLAGYVIAAIVSALYIQGLLVEKELIVYSWGAAGRPGPLYPVFVLYTASLLLGSIAAAWSALQTAETPAVRLRVKYLLLAMLPAAVLGLLNFLPNYGISTIPLGGVGAIAFVVVMAYGAVRHRLMEIDALFIRTAGAAVAAIAVALPLIVAIVAAERSLGHNNAFSDAVIGIALLIGMFSYDSVRARLEAAIERSLFPSRHQGRRAIEELSRNMVELAHRDKLAEELSSTLAHGLGLAGAALYVSGPNGRGLVNTSMGRNASLQEIPSAAPTASDATEEWDLCIPIGNPDEPLGLIALGPKLSGGAIDDIDRTLLSVVASQIAVALKNIDYVRQVEQQKDAIERQKTEIEGLQKRVQAENTVLRAEVRQVSGFREIIGSSPALQRVLDLVDRTASSDMGILVTGETGTGKELIARAIHERSDRRDGPLISVNCPAIPSDLAEAELFGCERGAFTGASEARAGRFELAQGGTIFLDEVGDLPYDIQTKLLRVLQEKQVQRLGSHRTRKVDVRVVAATNRDLNEAIARGRFREDLYHRLAAVVAVVPALREREDDIDILATAFLDRAATTHRKTIAGFGDEAMSALRSYHWPGNVRELQNVVERAVLLCDGPLITAEHLGDLAVPPSARTALGTSLREEKLRRLQQALDESDGNQAAAARRLGISRSNFSRLMKSLGIKSPRTLQ